jgi:predicted negative regulator of RcsB-dependent stress response
MLGLHTVETTVVPIVVALIAAAPAFLAVRRFRKENNNQHDETSLSLEAVLSAVANLDNKVDRVESKIDRHLGEHDATQTFSARTARARAARNH